jgi:hypothetical protein
VVRFICYARLLQFVRDVSNLIVGDLHRFLRDSELISQSVGVKPTVDCDLQ